MKFESVETVGIVGAGTMGLGIAQVCAMAGYTTTLFDVQPEAVGKAFDQIQKNLEKGISLGKLSEEQKEAAIANLRGCTVLEDLQADLIIEAVVERLDVKQQLFQRLEKVNKRQSILATNTSSIPITQIGAGLEHPDRLVGLHFFNPAHIMKLVEVIAGAATDEAIVLAAKAFAEKVGKKAIVAKDAPGFIVNRVARHFYVESLLLAEEQVCEFEGIDALLEASGFRMGAFRLMDLIGVNTNFSVTTSMYDAFWQAARFRPSRLQQQKVDAGHWGRKTKRGFYRYDEAK